MQIQPICKQNFNARLCGDYRDVIRISKAAKLSDERVKFLLDSIQKVLPGKDAEAHFYFRGHGTNAIGPCYCTGLISQVEILKPGATKRIMLGIDPMEIKQKDLLAAMVTGIKKLATGKVTPDDYYKTNYIPRSNCDWITDIVEKFNLKY